LAKHVTKLKNVAGKITIIKAPDADTLKGYMALKPGFSTKIQSGYLWVYRVGSDELEKANKGIELAKHATAIENINGRVVTVKAPSQEIIRSYLATKDGFTAFIKKGYLWVFRNNSKELAKMQEGQELVKHTTTIRNINGRATTIKSSDKETIECYLAAKSGFVIELVDGRIWVFLPDSKEHATVISGGSLAKHVTRLQNINGKVQVIKSPTAEILDLYAVLQ